MNIIQRFKNFVQYKQYKLVVDYLYRTLFIFS